MAHKQKSDPNPAGESKQDLVYEQVHARLSEGAYPAGHRVSVAQISRELGVSTIPVREALRRLEAEGWLEHAPNAGMRVAARDIEAWVDMMTPFAVLSGFATAEAAAALRTDGGLDELRAINDAMRDALAVDDYAGVTEGNWRFHQRIFDSTPHPELRRSLSETWQRLQVMRRELYGTIPLRAMQSLTEHDELIDLLEQEAGSFEIEAVARAHTLRTVAASRAASAANARGSAR